MKTILFLFAFCILSACKHSDPTPTVPETTVKLDEPVLKIENETIDTIHKPKVILVPCSNGYDYLLKGYDLNQTLEEVLEKDQRIELTPFPYAAMKGSGYHGVFDKKYCSKILRHVDADYLIMTEILGSLLKLYPVKTPEDTIGLTADNIKPNWGYNLKVLNTKSLHQFNSISSKNLESFDGIRKDFQSKFDQLYNQLITNLSTKTDNQ